MYSQGLNENNLATEETPEFLAAFQARIDADEKIEPNDPLSLGHFDRNETNRLPHHCRH